jgi:hypothetical protein
MTLTWEETRRAKIINMDLPDLVTFEASIPGHVLKLHSDPFSETWSLECPSLFGDKYYCFKMIDEDLLKIKAEETLVVEFMGKINNNE